MIYGNNQYSNNQYGKNRNGNKYGRKHGIKTYNLRSGKYDTQSDTKDVDFEASVINAIESDVNMNKNYGKEDQQLQYEKQNNGRGLYCITSHLTNSYSILGDQDSRFNKISPASCNTFYFRSSFCRTAAICRVASLTCIFTTSVLSSSLRDELGITVLKLVQKPVHSVL